MVHKIIFIDYNFIDKRYPNSPNDGDKFFTYGFGSLFARQFKKYNPDLEIECWKADPRIKNIYSKKIEGVNYLMYPSLRLKKFGHFSLKLLKSIRRELKYSKGTVLFVVISIRHLLFYSVSFLFKKHPLVVINLGETTALYKSRITKGLKKFFYLLQIPLELICYEKIDLLLVLDEKIKNYFPKKLHNLNVKTYRIGIKDDIFKPYDKTEAKKMLGLDINTKYIIYVGRLNKTKRPDILIDVYNELKIEYNNIGLILAGAEKEDEFYDYAVNSGAIIYGVIPQTELYKYLSTANLYVLAKLDESIPFGGIGMLSVEALLCNTPIAGSTVECFPKEDRDKVGIVTNDHSSLKDAILYIFNNENKYKNTREIALKHYSWENVISYVFNELENICSKYINKLN